MKTIMSRIKNKRNKVIILPDKIEKLDTKKSTIISRVTTNIARVMLTVVALFLVRELMPVSEAATNDPLVVISNLSDFMFGLIRAIGMILLGWGVVQIGLALKSHDPSQRANGFLTLAGGLIITFAKEILNIITGG